MKVNFTLDFALGGHSSGADHGGSANSGEKGLREHLQIIVVVDINVDEEQSKEELKLKTFSGAILLF